MRDPPEVRFRRDEIREIRVDHGDDANAVAGAAIGGATGATFGAIAAESSKGAAAFLSGTIGAAIGARVGQDVHVLRGKVIYRSGPAPKRQKKSPDAMQAAKECDLTVQTSP